MTTGEKNITLSLKTTKYKPEFIFFETISNCNKNSPGWGYYSKADYIIFTFGFPENIQSFRFKIKDILNLDLNLYKKAYGKTENLYRTEGRLIPLKDFKNERIL